MDVARLTTLTFLGVYSLQLFLHVIWSCCGLRRNKDLCNLHVVIQTIMIAITLLVHIHSLLFFISYDYEPEKLDYWHLYLFFQVPFDIMNIATIAHIYSWTDIQQTLEFFEFVREK